MSSGTGPSKSWFCEGEFPAYGPPWEPSGACGLGASPCEAHVLMPRCRLQKASVSADEPPPSWANTTCAVPAASTSRSGFLPVPSAIAGSGLEVTFLNDDDPW